MGTIVNEGRSLDIPMTFLGESTHIAKVYQEDPDRMRNVVIDSQEVTATSTITAKMGSGGGHAIWIYPSKK